MRGGEGGGEVGVPQKIMHALCAVIRPDQFKFASYGPGITYSIVPRPSQSQRVDYLQHAEALGDFHMIDIN